MAAEPGDDVGGRELLDRAAAFYAGLEAVRFDVKIIPEPPPDSPMQGLKIPPLRFEVTVAAPDRVALVAPKGAMEATFVQDGKQQYFKMPFLRSYVVTDHPKPLTALLDEPEQFMLPAAELLVAMGVVEKSPLLRPDRAELLGEETIDGIECHRLRIDGKSAGELWISRGEQPWVVRFRVDPPPTQPSLETEASFAFMPRLDLHFSEWTARPDLAFGFEIPDGFERLESVAALMKKLESGEPEVPEGELVLHGKPAPDVLLQPMRGNTLRLVDLRGRVVVLDFWATWCGPCIVDLPIVKSVVEGFDEKDVAFYAVNRFETEDRIDKFMKDKELPLPVVIDGSNEVAAAFGVQGIPHLVVIDREGVIRHVHIGAGPETRSKLTRELESLVGTE